MPPGVTPGGCGRDARTPGLRLRSSGVKPHFVFLVFAVAGGLLLLVLTPPFQVPDEPSHFYRAYAISEGHFTARLQRGSPGEMLPAAIYEVVKRYLRLVTMQEIHTSWSEILQSRQV